MKPLLLLLSILLLASIAHSQEEGKVSLAKDGFPTGSNTPEGAACDLVRSFINLDTEQFLKTCLPKKREGSMLVKEYNNFLDKVVKGTTEEIESGKPHPRSPRAIGKVFSARFLSKNGPSSFGYAVYGYHEVMFVDVGSILHDGSQFLNRTMVVKSKGGKWYVHPCPTIDHMLSMGLNQEAPSTEDFKTKYDIGVKDDGAVE